MHVTEAMEYLIQEEENRLIDMDQVTRTAVERAEQSGIIFLDEIDKIAGRERGGGGPDVSREGVQRDILPIVEGTTVNTRYGMVRTDHVLFIAAGAFHVSKPSDLIPELQGRFPIRVELHSLTTEDFIRILKEPKSALVKQYIALLDTEGIKLTFTDEALQEIAKFAAAVNEATENIGARRLHTIMEKLLDEISFEGPDLKKKVVRIDALYVQKPIDGHRQESGPQPIHPVKPNLRARRAAAPNFSLHRSSLPKRILPALALACAAGWLYGCGVQGTPHPPRLERPAKITNLSAVQIGQSLEMHFRLPQQTTEGERLTKPLEIEILRAVAPQGTGLAKLPEPEVWTRLIREEWLPYAQDNNVSYSAHLTEREFHDWRGQTLVVAVRTLTRGFRHRALESDPSNFVDVPILDVSEPVGSVQCVVTEKAVEVQFPPPTRTLSGEPIHDLAGYRIYRSSTGQAGSFELLGETAASPYRDSQFEFGQTYYYQVSAVFGTPGHLAMSDASPASEGHAARYLPACPAAGITGIYSAGAVELVWTANTEADLAGYNVYRLDDQTAQRVNKELVRTPIFRDTTATPGKTLTYYVTAVDLSGNESKASEKEEVETK